MSVAGLSSTAVREAVAELLGVSPGDVDPDADLIGQGLDSIRMMSLAGKWRKRGIDVDFASLAASPSVRAWSELIEAGDDHRALGSTPDPAAEGPDPDAGEPFPLAPMQHAMWVGREGEQHLGGVAGHLYVEFDGPALDFDTLVGAATALADRHPMLRVQFRPDGTQCIGPAPRAFPVTVTDYRASTDAEVAARLAAVRGAKSHQQLDGAVFELTLSQLPGERTRLHVDLDMQAADAMSYRTLMTDLAQLYRGADLPPLDYTYRRYRLATDATAGVPADPTREADQQWWNERLPDLPDAPRLPLVSPDPGVDSRHTTRRWHWFDPQAKDALFAAARERGITPAMAVAASFADALAGWSTERRFLLNLPMFGRDQRHPDVDRLVGDFTSSLLLDVDLTDSDTATARSRTLQTALHTAAAHSSHPGLAVLRDLARHRGAPVLAPIVYTSALGLGELFAPVVNETFGTAVWINSQGPQVLLDAQITEFDGGVLVNWDVRENVFEAGVIDAMFDRHVTELRRLAEDDTAWEEPPVRTATRPEVRGSVLTETAAPSGDTLIDGFYRTADGTPDAVAVIASTGTLTYAALRDRALAVAAALQSRGVGRGDVVGVLGPKNADQIPALLGILTAGAAYLPVGIDQPAERAARILDTAGVEFVLATGGELPDVALPGLTVHDAEIDGDPALFEAPAIAVDDLAYVLFTSGSTGEPKGVELTHDAVLNTLEFLYRHFEIGPGDRALALSHLESDMSVPDVFGTLRAGGAIVVVDEEDRRDPDAWARSIDRHGVTVVNFLPGWLDMLVEVAGPVGKSLDSLRVVLVGGDWVRPDLVRALRRLSPRARFAGLGGATETAIHATLYEVGPDLDVDAPARWPSIPYGRPFPNNACRVVGADGRDAPDWVPGELWFAGRGVARGYRGRPDLTAQKFVEHDGRIWYRSGDLARYWPDGTLEFVGRSDHRVKISGYRIELGEVEAALRRVGGVGGAVAAVVPRDGEGDVLGALVRCDDAGDVDTIRTALSRLVPEHMIPTVLVIAERLPIRNGKVDRKDVAARLADARPTLGAGHRSPTTHLESALADIFGAVLGRTVGVDDDFFSLGGDSVMATTAVARVRDWLDTPTVMVPDVFAARTVAQLAHRLSAREPEGDRLEQVAQLYVEVSDMDGVQVASELERASTPST